MTYEIAPTTLKGAATAFPAVTVRTINFTGNVIVTRGTGEQSNVITVRQPDAAPPPPPPPPLCLLECYFTGGSAVDVGSAGMGAAQLNDTASVAGTYLQSLRPVSDYSYAQWGDGANGANIGHAADTAWTMQLWVRPNVIASGVQCYPFRFYLGNNSGDQFFDVQILNHGGFGGLASLQAVPFQTHENNTPGIFTQGVWSHVAFVMSAGRPAIAKVYVDGVLQLTYSAENYNVAFDQPQTHLRVGLTESLSQDTALDVDDIKLCNEEEYTANFTPPTRTG